MKPALARIILGLTCRAGCAVLITLLLAACGGPGGSDAGLSALDPGLEPGDKAVPPQLDAAGLPSIASLANAVARGVRITGPGYQSVKPQEYVRAVNFASVPDGKLESSGLPPFAWAAYALGNFPTDAFPTDLKVTTDSTGQEFWIAFADFDSGKWAFSGPFNASAQIQLPFAGKPGGLRDYVSAGGRAMFMVAVAPGNDVVLAGLELGIDGGTNAPGAPRQFEAVGADAGVFLRWRHSLDYGSADFVGYQVERAPLLSGSFEPLHAEPSRDVCFLDSSAEPDVPYRYRVASVDTSGNRSYTATLITKAVPGADTPPVLKVRFPSGPFHGATSVDFDFSGSYDPDNTSISEHKATDISSQVVALGLDETQTMLLQPACYVMRLSVTSNGLTTSAEYQLKVYPKWNTSPVTVAGSPPGMAARLFASRMRYLDNGQRLAVFGHDSASDALVVWSGAPGGSLTPHRIWSLVAPDSFEEPIMYKGSLIIPMVTGPSLVCVSWNETLGASGQLVAVPAVASGISRCSVVTDGSNCYAVSATQSAAVYDLTITGVVDTPANEQRPVLGLPAIEAVSAAYNAGANAIDVAYSDGAAVKWLRWDIAGHSVVDGADLAAAGSTCIDVEINPATGQPGVAYHHGGKTRYREFDGSVWSGEELVDNNVTNMLPFDLRFAHGTRYLSCAVDTGYSALYEYDAGALNWVQRNTPAELASGGKDVTILQGAEPGEMLLLDRDSNNDVRLLSLLPGDNSSVLKSFDACTGLGLQLRGAPGSDGLHLVCLDSDGKPLHFKGDDNGGGWSGTPLSWNYATSIDIGAQGQGEVYLSLNNVDSSGDYQLEYWNPVGSAFTNAIPPLPGSADMHPFVGWHRGTNAVGWVYFDSAAGKLVRVKINQTDGPQMSDAMIGMDPVWRGALAEPNGRNSILLYGGTNTWDGEVSLLEDGASSVETLYDILFGGSSTLDPLAGLQVSGRTLDGTVYLEAVSIGFFGDYLPAEAYAVAQGPLLNLARVETDYLNQRRMVFEGEDNPFYALFSRDYRRTVSVADANGGTAVTLIANLGGESPMLRWSNYGEWEDLVVPGGLEHMNRPELLMSLDGRWNIVYQDWATNELKCLSSQ